MTDYHVIAWNLRRRRGLRTVNRAMTREEYHRDVSGRYDAEFVVALRPMAFKILCRDLTDNFAG